MATNPNELPFKQDPSGITYKLREIGKKACQDIRSESQHEAVKDTMKVLFKYADECLKDRLAEIEIELKEREARAQARAKFQHELPKEQTDDKDDKESA